MDFTLDDDQQLIVQSVREVMERENWEPYFQDCDESHKYPERWVSELAAIGLDTMMLPEEHGGMGANWVTFTAVWEELGRLGGPTYVLYELPSLESIFRVGTPEQIEKVKPLLGTGKQIWNSAMTEPGAGSSLRGIKTNYTRRDGKVYLNGQKIFITSSAYAPFLVVMARNADNPDQFTEWFVDMSKPGISKSQLDKLGLRMDSCCEIYFDNVELDESDLFGVEGEGFNRGVDDFEMERFVVACCDYGWAYCAYEDAARYANQREQGGEAIGRYELIQEKICSMRTDLAAMRTMLYEIAWKHDNGLMSKADCSMAKLFCPKAAARVVDNAIQIFGGIGVTGHHRVARFWRDLRVERISGGTDEMMVLTVGRAALKEYR